MQATWGAISAIRRFGTPTGSTEAGKLFELIWRGALTVRPNDR